MAQTNSNASNVLNNTKTVLPGTGSVSTASVSTSSVPTAATSSTIQTVLNSNPVGGVDNNTENGDYGYATALATGKFLDGTVSTLKISDVFANYTNEVNFLPTEAVAKTEWNADDKLADIAGSYLDGTTWKAPSLNGGGASAFTLSTTDTGRTVTLTETISGSPFTTGNGAVSEALTFRGANSDTLAIKHNVAVANVPASTNSNSTGSALDVRNETYAETYAKSGVTSNYANTTAHKYAEVNGNQALNDARAETYVYKDAGLAITSTVKTAVADAAYINGVERIVESNVANYHYADTDTVNGSSGTVDYIVTDTRNLAQSDQRTYTNITTTNVAQFKVVDKTVAAANGGALTVEASGIITGTTTNLSTPVPALVTIDGVPQAITFTSANNAKFHVFNTNYDLTIDSKEFTTDAKELTANALNQNVFDNVLGNGVKGLGNGGSLFAPINDATSQPVRPIELASAKYLPVATFLGTDFADVIKVNEIAGAVAGTFFGGNVNGGAGNDAITGSKGNDTIEGGAGKDVIDGGLGVNSLTGGFGQDTFVVSGTDTITDFVADVKEVIANPTAVPPVVGVTAVLGDTITIKPGATARIADTEDSHRFFTVSNPTTATTATTDMTIKTVAEWNAAKLSATLVEFDYSTLTTAPTATVNGTDNADLMLGSSFADKITGGKGHDTIKGGEGDDSLLNGLDGNDSVEGNGGNDVLRGNNGDDILIGGAGSDMLNGGAGKDVLTGGADADTFAFTSAPVAGDSTTITDFATTVDKIDLNGIDANSAIAANQDFSSTILAGTAAFTAAGQLRFNATTNTLEGNTDANFATTEFSVVLTGVAAVVATDFVL